VEEQQPERPQKSDWHEIPEAQTAGCSSLHWEGQLESKVSGTQEGDTVSAEQRRQRCVKKAEQGKGQKGRWDMGEFTSSHLTCCVIQKVGWLLVSGPADSQTCAYLDAADMCDSLVPSCCVHTTAEMQEWETAWLTHWHSFFSYRPSYLCLPSVVNTGVHNPDPLSLSGQRTSFSVHDRQEHILPDEHLCLSEVRMSSWPWALTPRVHLPYPACLRSLGRRSSGY